MSTNADISASRPSRPATFHADDGQDLEEYRSLSLLALVSLVIGLASPLCFTAPLMKILPLVGAVLALVALGRIAGSDGRLAGRGAALAGLALCLISLLAVVTYGQVTRLMRQRQAKEFGIAWIESLLAGDTEKAFRLTASGAHPRPASTEPGADPTNPYDTFIAAPLVRNLTSLGAGADVRLVDTISYERQSRRTCTVRQRFQVTAKTAAPTGSEPHQKSFDAYITLQRAQLPRESQARWLVVDYGTEPENLAGAL